MEVKCEFCGSMIDDQAAKCPNCGAPNPNMRRMADHTPKTIEELKQWYNDRHLPPYETTRFFIGINTCEPRVFGIYRDGREFVVYKNKRDGSRAIRYQGTDEAYAVNEIFLKLKSEILNQKARQQTRVSTGSSQGKITAILTAVLAMLGTFVCFELITKLAFLPLITIVILIAAAIFILQKTDRMNPVAGHIIRFVVMMFALVSCLFVLVFSAITWRTAPVYYHYNNDIYCFYDDYYYLYDYDTYDYEYISESVVPQELTDNPDEYVFHTEDGAWDSRYDFTESQYYADHYSSDSSDSDYDWDSGSDWDSGGSDWDSDW